MQNYFSMGLKVEALWQMCFSNVHSLLTEAQLWGCNLLTCRHFRIIHFSQLHWQIVRQRERERDREGLHPDLFWIERGWHPVCPTICVMFLASHQALLSGNSARRLMCAGGAAEYSANSAQQIWILCHMTAPKGAEKPQRVTTLLTLLQAKTHSQKSILKIS